MADWKGSVGFLHTELHCETKDFAIIPLPSYTSDLERIIPLVFNGVLYSKNLIQVQPSHILVLKNNREKDPRYGSAGYLLQFLSFCFSTRLQFEDWFLEGNIPFDRRYCLTRNLSDASSLIQAGYSYYRRLETAKLSQETRSRISRRSSFANALFVLGMAKASDFEWRELAYAWMALDGIWYASALPLVKYRGRNSKKYSGMHFNRVYSLSRHLGLHLKFRSNRFDSNGKPWPSTAAILWKCIQLRNDLIHQCLWAGLPIGHASSDPMIYRAGTWLTKYTQRAIVSIILGPNSYSSSDWTHPFRHHIEDLPPIL